MSTRNDLHVYGGTTNVMTTSDSYSEYEAGAKAGDVISSKTLNTAVRTATLVAKALVDALTKNQTTQSISHLTNASTLAQWIAEGIVGTKVNNAVASDKWNSAITITFGGKVTGQSFTMDGSANKQINITALDVEWSDIKNKPETVKHYLHSVKMTYQSNIIVFNIITSASAKITTLADFADKCLGSICTQLIVKDNDETIIVPGCYPTQAYIHYGSATDCYVWLSNYDKPTTAQLSVSDVVTEI